MAKYNDAEFAALCGVATNYIRTYVSRNKIIRGEDGLIDTSLPMNADFITQRRNADGFVERAVPEKAPPKKVGRKPKPKPPKKSPKKPVPEPIKLPKKGGARGPKPKGVDVVIPPMPKQDGGRPTKKQSLITTHSEAEIQKQVHNYNLDKQIKEAELEKKEQEIELNRLKIAKLSGEVIPTELVKNIFAQHFKSVTTAFHQGADNFIMTIAKMTGMNRDEMGKIRGQLIEIVNESVKEGVENSRESIRHLVREYGDKRGVGEKR